MFYLNEIEHSLRLPNYVLNLPLNEAIKGELEGLFLDKVSTWLHWTFYSMFSSLLSNSLDVRSPFSKLIEVTVILICICNRRSLQNWGYSYLFMIIAALRVDLSFQEMVFQRIWYLYCTASIFSFFITALQVRFRLVIFLPFVGEVIAARLKESASDGLRWITRCSDGWGPISWWPGFDAVQGWCSQRVDENGQWISQSPCA